MKQVRVELKATITTKNNPFFALFYFLPVHKFILFYFSTSYFLISIKYFRTIFYRMSLSKSLFRIGPLRTEYVGLLLTRKSSSITPETSEKRNYQRFDNRQNELPNQKKPIWLALALAFGSPFFVYLVQTRLESDWIQDLKKRTLTSISAILQQSKTPVLYAKEESEQSEVNNKLIPILFLFY